MAQHTAQPAPLAGHRGDRRARHLQLLTAGRLAGLAVYGSPYLWQTLKPLLPPDLPAAYSPGQMPQAQAVLLDQLGLGAAALEGGFTD